MTEVIYQPRHLVQIWWRYQRVINQSYIQFAQPQQICNIVETNRAFAITETCPTPQGS